MVSTSSIPTPEALIDSFPTPNLPSIQGEPTYHPLAAILTALKANAASIPSNQGGAANGYLGIVVSSDVYATISPGNPFLTPTNPTQHPTIPRNSTDAATSTIIRRHTEKLREWKEYNTVQRALKKQLAQAIDKIYLEAHSDENVGYENVTIHTLIQYLFDEYGDITPLDLRANAKRLNEEWDPNQPIQTLFSHIKAIQTYAQAGNRTFTDHQIVDAAYTTVYNTGLYFDDCDTWLDMPTANQTWTNFQTHFNTAHRKAKRKQRTTQSEGYHGANAAIEPDTTLQAENEAALEALANMATAMSADRTTMSQLTTAITDLTTQLNDKNHEISSLKSRLRGNSSNHSGNNNSRSNNNNNNNGSNNNSSGNSNGHSSSSMWTNGKHIRDRGGYCWSHGFLVVDGHTSANCFHPKNGHKQEATREHNMGGNDYGKPRN
jgi:hypothetical protein